MKLDRASLRKILISEACGCMSEPIEPYELDPEIGSHKDHEMVNYQNPATIAISRDSVLECVAALAMSVSCPVTRDRLLDAVRDLIE